MCVCVCVGSRRTGVHGRERFRIQPGHPHIVSTVVNDRLAKSHSSLRLQSERLARLYDLRYASPCPSPNGCVKIKTFDRTSTNCTLNSRKRGRPTFTSVSPLSDSTPHYLLDHKHPHKTLDNSPILVFLFHHHHHHHLRYCQTTDCLRFTPPEPSTTDRQTPTHD